MPRILSILIFLTIIVGSVKAVPTPDQEQEVRTSFVTPHTKWAKPYAGGTTRVLFFSDYRNTQAREIVELMQRFDISADAAYYYTVTDTSEQQWHGGVEGIARIQRLLQDNAYDVFLFNGIDTDKLPPPLEEELLKKVKQGKGLVLVGIKELNALEGKLSVLAKLTLQNGNKVIPEGEQFLVGQGRMVRLPAVSGVDYAFGWEVPYDHWQELLGRSVLWAAGKLLPAQLEVSRVTIETGWEGAPHLNSQLRVIVPDEQDIAYVHILERREDGLVVRESVVESTNSELLGPRAIGLPAGGYFDDVIAIDRAGRVIDWAILKFSVPTLRTPEIKLSKTWGEIGESITGAVKLVGLPLEDEQVFVELRDRRGRILATTMLALTSGAISQFSFPIPGWYPMLVQVRAVLRNRYGEVADAMDYFNITKRHRDRFNLISWDVPQGPTAAWAHEALARLGVTVELRKFATGVPKVMAAYDMAAVPYSTRILDKKDPQGLMLPLPWNKEPEINRYVEDLVAKNTQASHHGVFAYSLGDEVVTRGSDTSPSDLVAYRNYLQKVYGDISVLNANWDSGYSDFESINLLDANDPTEGGARRAGNYSRWYDRQAWESINFLGLCRRYGDAFRQLDPQARTGFEGAGRLESGDDIDGIVHTNGFWTPYPGLGDQVVRGIAPRDFAYSNWMGYAKDDSLTWSYWRMVLNGSHGVWWWRWDNIGRYMGLLRPDLTPPDEVTAMLEDTRITREGLGDMLLRSQMETDGIAILYSPPSIFAAQVGEGPSYGQANDNHAAWQQTLFNLGLSFGIVTDAMLHQGELDAKKIRVLIMPRVEALGDEDAVRLQSFVEGGGTLIADVRPGMYTDRLKPREVGVLDALFGVDSRGSAEAVKKAVVEVRLGEGQPAWRFEGMTVDSGIMTNGASVLGKAGETPVLFSNVVGRGRAVLLNFSLASYPRVGAVGSPAGTSELWQELFRQAGVAPPLTLVRADGKPIGDVRVQRWRNGGIELVGIMQEPERRPTLHRLMLKPTDIPRDYVLTLDGPRWVYDLRDGESLGQQTKVRLTLHPGRATFLALLPGEDSALRATLAQDQVKPGQTASLLLDVPDGVGDHVVKVTMVRPDGIEADWIPAVAMIPRGETVRMPIPVACNDPEGHWEIRLQELITGRVTELKLTVKK